MKVKQALLAFFTLCVFTFFQFVLSTHLSSSTFSRSQQNRTLLLLCPGGLTRSNTINNYLVRLFCSWWRPTNILGTNWISGTLNKNVKFRKRKALNLHFAARTPTSCSYSPEVKGKKNVHPFLFLWDKASCTRKQELFFFICHGSGLSTYTDNASRIQAAAWQLGEGAYAGTKMQLVFLWKAARNSPEASLDVFNFVVSGRNKIFTYVNFSCFICWILWSGFISADMFHSSGLLSVVGWRVISVSLTQDNALDLQGLNWLWMEMFQEIHGYSGLGQVLTSRLKTMMIVLNE